MGCQTIQVQPGCCDGETPPNTVTCENCVDNVAPPQFIITFAGYANVFTDYTSLNTSWYVDAGTCGICSGDTSGGGCKWCAVVGTGDPGTTWNLCVYVQDMGGGNYQVRVFVYAGVTAAGEYILSYTGSKPDCMTFSSTNVPRVASPFGMTPTCTITSVV